VNKYSEFSARASLMVVGVWMQSRGIWDRVEETVQIKQKVVKYRPIEKLLDGLISMVAGGSGLVEINTRVRPDVGLQRAFGRMGCAEQSVVSQTFDACTTENVDQMRQALGAVYRTHSAGYRHNYRERWQVLDVDMSALPTDIHGEGVEKGYFGPNRRHRGRQLGRVCATLYDEIVVQQLFTGKRQLHHSLRPLMRAAEGVLDLKPTQRQRTLVRVDSGGGEEAHLNWLLRRGYAILAKAQGTARAAKLAQTIRTWTTDPHDPTRQMAFVPQPHRYAKPTVQVVVRTLKQNGTWAYARLVCSAPYDLLCQLAHRPVHANPTETDHLLALVYAYDYRGGGIETQFKADKYGLAMAARRKHRFPAQEMLLLLLQLAHHLLIWTRTALAQRQPAFARLGIHRLVRDLFAIPGQACFDPQGHLCAVLLNGSVPLAPPLVHAFPALLLQPELALALD
jgi:hypothetical protein